MKRDQIALGKNDNEVDWLAADQALTLTATEDTTDDTGFTWSFAVAPPAQVMIDFGDGGEHELVTGGHVHHTYLTAGSKTATVSWPGYTSDDDTFTVVDRT